MGPNCYHESVRHGREVEENILPDEIENRKADVHKQALDYKSGGIVTVEWGIHARIIKSKVL